MKDGVIWDKKTQGNSIKGVDVLSKKRGKRTKVCHQYGIGNGVTEDLRECPKRKLN